MIHEENCTDFRERKNICFLQEIKEQNYIGLLSNAGSQKTILEMSSENYFQARILYYESDVKVKIGHFRHARYVKKKSYMHLFLGNY